MRPDEYSPEPKPNGKYVMEMYSANKDLFTSGLEPLEPGAHGLNANRMIELHQRNCGMCKRKEGFYNQCYFPTLIRTITHGWKIPLRREISRKYEAPKGGNWKNAVKFHGAIVKEMNSQINTGSIRLRSLLTEDALLHPMNAVLRKNDIARAEKYTGIKVVDQATLDEVNDILKAQNRKAVKVRPSTDCSASGLNDASAVPPFSYPSLADALEFITPNCYLAKTDLEKYYYQFPIAKESRKYFNVQWDEDMFDTRGSKPRKVRRYGEYWRLCFGYGPCPYYASTWSAELRIWCNELDIPLAWMMDDWLTKGDSYNEASERIICVEDIFESTGLPVSKEKREVGQRIAFLGITIDTKNMIVSIDSDQASTTRTTLAEFKEGIIKNRYISETERRSIAGKLNWFSEVVQSGRSHTRSFWLFTVFGNRIQPHHRERLLYDISWWDRLLISWSDGKMSGIEYPILTAQELLNNEATWVIQSDASGTDGYGYFAGTLDDENPYFYSSIWEKQMNKNQSHMAELTALLRAVSDVPSSTRLVIWITDCLSAAWSVNKGGCSADTSMDLIDAILDRCDDMKISIVAIWIPREENELADYLSHLSHMLFRDHVDGKLSELGAIRENARRNYGESN